MLDLEREIEGLITDEDSLDEFRINKLFPLMESKPEAVFKPSDKKDILKLIDFAKKNNTALIPLSSTWDFFGSARN